MRQVFDTLELSSSHLAMMIDESNLTLLAGGSEFSEWRYPVGALIFDDCTVPSSILWHTMVSHFTLRFFA